MLHTLEGHDDAVICCAFNHDNTKVLTTSHDKTVKVYSMLRYTLFQKNIYNLAPNFLPVASSNSLLFAIGMET